MRLQFYAFYPKLRICMPQNAICFCFSKVVKVMSLKQMLFKCCFISILVNIYFIKLFAQELNFSQKLLENDFIILESTESHFPELFCFVLTVV